MNKTFHFTTQMEGETTRYCRGCRRSKPLTTEFFRMYRGELTKTCLTCLVSSKRWKESTRCEHGRLQGVCAECGGGRMCIHGKLKYYCAECGGEGLCEHGIRRTDCKQCSDPIGVTIGHILRASKYEDKRRGQYDKANFIDYKFVKELIDNCRDKCYYCECDLQYVNYVGNMGTIERLSNDLGHIKSNCVIACRSCNQSGGSAYRDELKRRRMK